MNKLWIMFALLCLSFTGREYTLIEGLPFREAYFLTTDKLGNAYVLAGNQLLQFSSAGKPKANFSESSLGELRSVDSSDPMKTLLFFPDFGRLLILNAQLAIQSSIHLRELGVHQPILACGSDYGGYWVFDRQDFQLKKIDLNLQVVYQSGDMLTLTGLQLNPDFIIETGGSIYLKDSRHGIFVFDRYGTFHKKIPITGVKSLQVIGTELLYISDNRLKVLHMKTQEEREILLPSSASLKFARFENQELYLLTSDSLAFYSF